VSLERVQFALLAAIAATCLVSIFAAQLFLAVALGVFALRAARGESVWPPLAVGGPILAFCVWTLLSASFSLRPLASHESAKKLVLFALLWLAADAFRREQARDRLVAAALLGGCVLAAGALAQFYLLGFDTLDNRPRSFLGHYMTASGLSMGVLVLATARLGLGPPPRRPSGGDLARLAAIGLALLALTALKQADLFAVESERLFVAGVAALAVSLALSRGAWPGPGTLTALATCAAALSAWALLVSRTRSAWLGTLAGLGLLALLKAPRALWLLTAAVAAVLIVRPATVADRLTLSDASSLDRYYMWQAGLDMVMDKPVFGQGPGMIGEMYPRYRWPEAPNPMAPHLHDNLLQIAAERGLPCLVFWLWLVAALAWQAWREARQAAGALRWPAAAALAVLLAIMVAGTFEYNFGDSEVLMFTLLVSALPFGTRLAREGSSPA
jgi:hypothetical protein